MQRMQRFTSHGFCRFHSAFRLRSWPDLQCCQCSSQKSSYHFISRIGCDYEVNYSTKLISYFHNFFQFLSFSKNFRNCPRFFPLIFSSNFVARFFNQFFNFFFLLKLIIDNFVFFVVNPMKTRKKIPLPTIHLKKTFKSKSNLWMTKKKKSIKKTT